MTTDKAMPTHFYRQGWLFALIATVIYSTNAPVVRGAILAGMDPNTLVFGRFVLGNVLFALTLQLTSMGEPRGTQRPFDRRGLLYSLTAGIINGLMLLAASWGLTELSASIATLLSIALTPLFVMGLLRLRGERIHPWDLLRLGIGLLGLYFLLGFNGAISRWGILMTVMSAFLYALHMVIVQWFLRAYNRWSVTAALILGASFPAGFLWWHMGANFYVPGAIGWFALILQGVAATYIARILIYEAVNRIGSAQISLLTPLEAALTVLWSMLWLAEVITVRQSMGIALILVSTALAARLPRFSLRHVRKLATWPGRT